MADSASGIESDTADKMKIYQEKFEDFNKNFNPEEMGTDRMSFKSFKKIMKGIKCLKNVKLDSIFENEATEGTPEKYIDFQQFTRCLDKEIETEASARRMPTQDFFNEQALKQIRKLDPKNVSKKLMSILAKVFGFGDSLKDVSSATGVTLKEIAKTTVAELSAVGASVQWIGPVIVVLKVLWERFEAFQSIKEDAAMFADTLLYLSDTVAFIGSNQLYHTDMMEKRMKKLKEILDEAQELWKKVDGHKDKKAKRFFTAKEDCENLEKMMKKIKKWVLLALFGQSAENQEITLKIKSLLDEVKETTRENKSEIAEIKETTRENKSEIAEIKETTRETNEIIRKFMEAFEEVMKKCRPSCDQRNIIMATLKDVGVEIAEEDNYDATAPGEGSRRSETIFLPNHNYYSHQDTYLHRQVNSAETIDNVEQDSEECHFLIYHDERDEELALQTKREMEKMSTYKGEKVKIKVLFDDFHMEGMPQNRLKRALECPRTVKLILVTENLATEETQALVEIEVYKILRSSTSGQVFVLLGDEKYNSYKKKLDEYVRSLVDARCKYDIKGEKFVDKMYGIFKKNVTDALAKEKVEKPTAVAN